MELPYRATQFKVLEGKNFRLRLSPYNAHITQIDGYNILVADSLFRPIQKAFYQYSLSFFRAPYFANFNGQYFSPIHQAEILSYDNGSLHTKYHLSFGDMSVDKTQLEETYGGLNCDGKEYWDRYFTRNDCFALGNYVVQQFFCGKPELDRCLILDTRDNRTLFFKSLYYDTDNVFGIDFNFSRVWGASKDSGELFCQVLRVDPSSMKYAELMKLKEMLPDSIEKVVVVSESDMRNPTIAFFTLHDNLMSRVMTNR